MHCPYCGQENQEEAKFCLKCGKEVGGPSQCPSCGKEIPPEALFCSGCGRSIGASQGSVGYGNTSRPQEQEPQRGSFASNIALDIILSIITCGIYWFFWQARQIRALNHLLKEQRFSFVLWFFVSIITCFLFNVYYEYIMAQAIVEIQKRDGKSPSNDLPILSLVLSLFGLHIVVDAIQQNELNKFFEK